LPRYSFNAIGLPSSLARENSGALSLTCMVFPCL
jgi:hypothetical protein